MPRKIVATGPPKKLRLLHVVDSLLAQAAIYSLRAGKHVLLEKTMALDHIEAPEVVKASEKSKQKLMVGTRRGGASSR